VRFVLAALGISLAAFASADRFLETPTGYSLRYRQARAEAWWASNRDFDRAFVSVGVMQSLEVGASFDRRPGFSDRVGFDLSYNYLGPILDYAPGISVGVFDLFNETLDGRSAYLALTMRTGNYDPGNQDVPTEFTLGFWSRHGGSPFLSVSLPFAEEIRLISEFEGREISAGFDIRPVRGMTLRWVFVDGRPTYGIGFKTRF
jgi:hypothetical protein